MKLPFLHDSDAPRPPLAGRLTGLAVGLALLSGAVCIAANVVQALIPIVVPLIVMISIYSPLLLGRRVKFPAAPPG
jgi:hypothetical protein